MWVNLVPLKKGQRESEVPTKKIDYRAGDIKHQVGNIAKSVMSHFYFQSFGEYRTLLEQFNVTVEEINGEHKEKPYQGLVYSVINDNGEKVGVPFKSSLFGKSAGYDAMQKHFELSKSAIEKNRIRENLRPTIAKAMKESKSITDFKSLLKEKSIGAIFRLNEQDRIYGVTFIDYRNQTILNGSRLGKEFSANQFQSFFNESPVKEERPEQQVNYKPQPTKQSSPSLNLPNVVDAASSLFSIFDIEPQGDNNENMAFAKEKEYEEKQRQQKAKKRKRGRQI